MFGCDDWFLAFYSLLLIRKVITAKMDCRLGLGSRCRCHVSTFL
ncbi:hypothetical protein [Methanoregula sp.]